jgi:hypothetical protein
LSSVSAEEQETSQSIRRHSLSLRVLFVCVTFVIRVTKFSATATIQTYIRVSNTDRRVRKKHLRSQI